MIHFRVLSLLAVLGVGSALSCGDDSSDGAGSSGASAGKGGASAGAGSAGVGQAGSLVSGGTQAGGKGGGGGGSGASAGKGGRATAGKGGTAGAMNGGASGVGATSGLGSGGDGELCGGEVCGPSEFCCGPAECGVCAPELSGPSCPTSCGAGGAGGQSSACLEDCEASGFECCDGVCVNFDNDVENCGQCGNRCTTPARYCDNGTCGEPECETGTTCGGGEQCCGEECCGSGQLCCVVPGGPQQPARCVDSVNATCPAGCPTCP